MTRQEAFNAVFSRMMKPENYKRRNPVVFDDVAMKIMNYVEDLKHILEVLTTTTDTKAVEAEFDSKYHSLVKLLDEQGWK